MKRRPKLAIQFSMAESHGQQDDRPQQNMSNYSMSSQENGQFNDPAPSAENSNEKVPETETCLNIGTSSAPKDVGRGVNRGRGRGKRGGRGKGSKRHEQQQGRCGESDYTKKQTHRGKRHRDQEQSARYKNFQTAQSGTKSGSDREEFYDAMEYDQAAFKSQTNTADEQGSSGSFPNIHHQRSKGFHSAQNTEKSSQYPTGSQTSPKSAHLEQQNVSSGADTAPRRIVVRGFGSSIDEDILSMYFENKRKSGGGDIECIEMDPSNNSATIAFCNSSGQ